MKKKIISVFTMMFLCGIFNLSAQSVRIGSQAPDFSIELQKDGKPSGKTVTLADYKGKALLLHFWATWCPPCKVELPHLEKLVQKIQSKVDNSKINFLAVCISDSQNSLTSFMKKNGYTFSGGLDATGRIAMKYGIQGVPTSILISPEGKVLKIHVGMMNEKLLENFVSGYDL